jgi:hypothetical protein
MTIVHLWEIPANPAYNGRYNGYWEVEDSCFTEDNVIIGEKIKVGNGNGGYHYHTINDQDEFYFNVHDWHQFEVMYHRDDLADYPDGWIDRIGEFYGCSSMDHNRCCYSLFGIDEGTAEQTGYIKIYQESGFIPCEYCKKPNDKGYVFYCKFPPNEEQKNALRRKGFDID